MRKDDGVDGDAQRIGQLTWMLFLKIFDQCEETWEDDLEDKGVIYSSPLPEEFRWRNWAKYTEDETGKKQPRIACSDLIPHVTRMFEALKSLPLEQPSIPTKTKKAKKEELVGKFVKGKVIREVFQDANNYMKSGTLMLGVIEKLDDAVDFHDMKSRGQMGQIYEQILNDLRSAGNAGEFYTPRSVTEFMVQMVNPSLKKRERVMDPACGTGGFLTATITHFEKQLTKKSGPEDKKAIADCIRGIEKKQLPHLLCTTNMLLHGIEVPSMIEHRNTLGKAWNDWSPKERVDCVITNPPFGGLEDDGVGADFPSDIQTKETADMFLVLIVKKLLKDKGGRGAVVLPDGTLFGEGVKAKVKELLMDNCQLHTIIRLPKGVFNPYTGIKTNLLFFTKGKPTDTIWFYEHQYPEGVKNYSKTKPLRVEELKPIADWWGKESNGFKDRVESEQAWKVDFKQLKADATSKAQPHWDKAESLNNDASELVTDIKDLRSGLKSAKTAVAKKKINTSIDDLNERIDALREQVKDEQATGDRHYWPIYNLDIKNPNTPEDEILDPDKLLTEYKTLLEEIEKTQNQLRDELADALSHHFETETSVL